LSKVALKWRKARVWLIALAVLFSSWAAPVSAAFRDTGGHWAEAAIDAWQGYGVVSGFDGAFRPDDPVTRAEFAVMLDNIMKYQVQGQHGFPDLPAGKWYTGPMARLHAAGVLSGADGKALPDKPVSRQEAAALLARAFGLTAEDGASVRFADEDDIAGWAKDAVRALVSRGVLNGYPDGTFKPERTLSRAEAVTMFDRLIARFIHAPGEYGGDADGIVVINAPDVTLKDAVIAGDLYITQGVGDGDVTLENVTVQGSVHVNGGGDGTIVFNGVRVSGALIVDKYDNKIHIVATGDTTVTVTVLESGAMLVTRELTGGGFETVEISADLAAGQEIALEGDFGKVVNRSPEVQITANGTIGELVAEADTNITGDVRIELVTVPSDDVAVAVNGEPATPGQPVATVPGGGSGGGGGTPGGGGSTPGGGGGNTPGGGSKPPKLTGLQPVQQQIYLSIGDTYRAEVAAEPAGAAVPGLIWYVADGSDDVVTVDQEGNITAVQPGQKYVVARVPGTSIYAHFLVHVGYGDEYPPPFVLEIHPYDDEWADPSDETDPAVVDNGSRLTVAENDYSLLKPYYRGWTIRPDGPMATVTDSVYAYVVLTVKDENGQPLQDPGGIQVSVYDELNGGFMNPNPGKGIGGPWKDSSFLLPIHDPNERQLFNIWVSDGLYAGAQAYVEYLPEGMPVLSDAGTISGAPVVFDKLEVSPPPGYDPMDIYYEWAVAEHEEGPYYVDFYGPYYMIDPYSVGLYIRPIAVSASASFGGIVVGNPVGPVAAPYTEDAFFDAWIGAMLGSNAGLTEITDHLDFAPDLPDFDGTDVIVMSSDETIIDRNGIVNRHPHADRKVLLHVVTEGVVNAFRMLEVTVKADRPADPYFDGVPRAYVHDDTGTVWVEFRLNKAADVFVTVNPYDYDYGNPMDVDRVIGGYSGPYEPVHTFYFAADPGKLEHRFDTGLRLAGSDFRVDFVIRDEAELYVSDEPTAILIQAEPLIRELGLNPPLLAGAHLNGARDAIYLYFIDYVDNKGLSDARLPAPGDFRLSEGTVTGVSVFNEPLFGIHYLKLDVSGVTGNRVAVSYEGADLRDESGSRITFQNVIAEHREPSGEAVLSRDRTSMMLHVWPGWPNNYNPPAEIFSVEIAGHGVVQPDYAFGTPNAFLVDWNGGYYAIVFLFFNNPLPEGDLTVRFDASGFETRTEETYPDELVIENVLEIAEPGTPSVAYDAASRTLTITFAEGFVLSEYPAFLGGLILHADGNEWPLRGFSMAPAAPNVLDVVLDDRYAKAVEEGTDVKLKYESLGISYDIRDYLDVPIPDFGYVPVIKK